MTESEHKDLLRFSILELSSRQYYLMKSTKRISAKRKLEYNRSNKKDCAICLIAIVAILSNKDLLQQADLEGNDIETSLLKIIIDLTITDKEVKSLAVSCIEYFEDNPSIKLSKEYLIHDAEYMINTIGQIISKNRIRI